jgi:hypothetical protein
MMGTAQEDASLAASITRIRWTWLVNTMWRKLGPELLTAREEPRALTELFTAIEITRNATIRRAGKV